MPKIPTWLPVVAVAMMDEEGRILMQQRPAGKAHADLWEFPGGKIEAAETPQEALCREAMEELGVALDPAALQPCSFAQSEQSGDNPAIVLMLYTARLWRGQPSSREGGQCGWFFLPEIEKLPMPPLDRELYERLLKIISG